MVGEPPEAASDKRGHNEGLTRSRSRAYGATQPTEPEMFTKILAANRGGSRSAAQLATKSHCLARAACAGDIATGG